LLLALPRRRVRGNLMLPDEVLHELVALYYWLTVEVGLLGNEVGVVLRRPGVAAPEVGPARRLEPEVEAEAVLRVGLAPVLGQLLGIFQHAVDRPGGVVPVHRRVLESGRVEHVPVVDQHRAVGGQLGEAVVLVVDLVDVHQAGLEVVVDGPLVGVDVGGQVLGQAAPPVVVVVAPEAPDLERLLGGGHGVDLGDVLGLGDDDALDLEVGELALDGRLEHLLLAPVLLGGGAHQPGHLAGLAAALGALLPGALHLHRGLAGGREDAAGGQQRPPNDQPPRRTRAARPVHGPSPWCIRPHRPLAPAAGSRRRRAG
jgi:hypothetical protein